ncbi:Uncharacterised protein [uncultured archaeon]|nr:Uncharacterised protein [uncultured archaeon]
MRKIWILGILLLMLVACAAPKAEEKATADKIPATVDEKAPVAADEKVAATPPATQEVGRTPPPVTTLPSERQQKAPETAPVVTQEMSPQLKELLKRADEKVSSLQYLYGGTSTKNLFLDTYLVKGTKMKIKKYSEDYYVQDSYYDTIYVDLGIGCCEEPARCLSKNVDNTKKKFDVDVTSIDIPKTPYQWTKEIPADAKIVGPQTVDERVVTYIKYTKDGATYDVWVDDTYGVPHKIVVTDANGNEVKYQFNDMKFNSLKDNDFDAPCD